MQRFTLVWLACLTLFGNIVVAQWANNSATNTLVTLGKDERYDMFAISDGSGNIYVTWYTASTGSTGGVFVQKISLSGAMVWNSGGVKVDSIANTFEKPSLALDGSGGVFVTWEDSRSDNPLPNIYGQHISSAGAVQWTANGVNLTQSFTIGFSFRQPSNAQMLNDGSTGTYISWDDAYGAVLMRINASGTIVWSAKIDTLAGAIDTRIAPDGSGGVILAWTDLRNSASGDYADIYAERVNSSGNLMWTASGVPVSNATNLQNYPQIVGDGSGGAVIAWQDFRDGAHYRGYAQKLNSSGVVQWTVNGLSLTSTTNSINALTMTTDGSGGGIFTWEEARGTGLNGSDNIYAQRVNAAGQRQWTDSGANVCTNTAPQEDPVIISDGNGGAFVAWDDNRNTGANEDIYAQRLNATGQAEWAINGSPVSSATGNQTRPFVVGQPNSAMVVMWYDFRANGGNTYADLYAQYVSGSGALSDVRGSISAIPESFQLQQNFPNPFNPTTQINFSVTHSGFVSLKVYDLLGREVATLVSTEMTPAAYSVIWDAANVSSGVYLYKLVAGGYSVTKKMMLMK